MEKEFLYCYKMTHDTGFAPNPYKGVLTLATCKPTIRRCAEKGFWISGWTSNLVLGKNNKKYQFSDATQKLIYLAKVADKMSIAEYWEMYKEKRPAGVDDMGDNIYKPIKGKDGEFEQLPNGGGHNEKNKQHDLSGKNVLICEEFYYFGVEDAIEIKNKGFTIPRCKKIPLDDDRAKNVKEYVTNNYSTGLYPKKK